MANNRKSLGTGGEAEAAPFLESQGYRIIDSNVRPQRGRSRGEIDLIAWHAEYLVFIEVKTRLQTYTDVAPAENVTRRKRKQLVKLAYSYLARYHLDDVPVRFDVVEVVRRIDKPAELRIITNAFTADDVVE